MDRGIESSWHVNQVPAHILGCALCYVENYELILIFPITVKSIDSNHTHSSRAHQCASKRSNLQKDVVVKSARRQAKCDDYLAYEKLTKKREKKEHAKEGKCVGGIKEEKEESVEVANSRNYCSECWREHVRDMYS